MKTHKSFVLLYNTYLSCCISTLLCIYSWFAVHCTSMNNTNTLISGDNKGYASMMMEKYISGETIPGRVREPIKVCPSFCSLAIIQSTCQVESVTLALLDWDYMQRNVLIIMTHGNITLNVLILSFRWCIS